MEGFSISDVLNPKPAPLPPVTQIMYTYFSLDPQGTLIVIIIAMVSA